MVASLGLRAAGYKLLASGLRAAWHYVAWQGATGRRATGCRLHGKVSKGVGLQARLPYLPPPSSMSYLLPSYSLFLHSPSCPPPLLSSHISFLSPSPLPPPCALLLRISAPGYKSAISRRCWPIFSSNLDVRSLELARRRRPARANEASSRRAHSYPSFSALPRLREITTTGCSGRC